MKRTYFIVLIFVAISISCTAQTVINATDPHLHYQGRTWTDNDAVVLSWSGNSVDINFTGSAISATLKDEGGLNTYAVVLDGSVVQILHPGETKNDYPLASGLSAGKHHLELFKRTEWTMGNTWFYGFTLGKGAKVLPASAAHKRKIEFYGNSITCGYAILDTAGKDRGTAEFEDGYNSYAPITARHYNAEFSSISRSGIGITISWFPQVMPEMYDRTEADNPNRKWDFSKYTPDVVVINLFQNDSWLVNMPNNEQFKARFGTTPPTPEFIINAYANFVKSIRAKYPKAQIVCILGSMDATKAGSPWPGYIQSAVTSLHDSRIYVHPIPYKGSYNHPNMKEQQAMADDLIAFIDKNVKW
jgi:hypothetical protein